jgi:hypothetical protein
VQLQVQLLNEKALQAQLQSDATRAGLRADRDESPRKRQVGAAMNANRSRAHANFLATRREIEKGKLTIAEEAR